MIQLPQLKFVVFFSIYPIDFGKVIDKIYEDTYHKGEFGPRKLGWPM